MTPPLEAEPTNPACRAALCSGAIDPSPSSGPLTRMQSSKRLDQGEKVLAAIG